MSNKKYGITLNGTEYVVTVREIADSQDISTHITGLQYSSASYTGSPLTPTVVTDGTVTLNTDYTVEYTDNVEPGIATVTVTGIGNYTGTKELNFTIIDNREDIAEHITGLEYNTTSYDGTEKKPTVITDGTVVLNTDYIVGYANNTAPGTATVTVTGINNYKETKTLTFTITDDRADISTHITGLEYSTVDYDGTAKTPAVTNDGSVTLNTDYTVGYANNTEPGTATVTVTGINTYKGTKELTFAIVDNRGDIATHVTGLEYESIAYDGTAKTPTVITDGTVTLNSDYTVKYEDNTDPGTATVTVTGINKYKNDKELTFEIVDNRGDITDHVTGLEYTTTEYDGTEKKPAVTTDGTVTLNTDYTVAYTDNVAVGTAKASVLGIGNYKNSVDYEFTITAPTEE